MKEKIRNWWIRNKNSNWMEAFLLTCLFSMVFLIMFGIVSILVILFNINIGLGAVAMFVLMFLGFLILSKVG